MPWEIPKSVDVETLVSQLGRQLGLAPSATTRSERTFVDSFDGRLWRAGFTLELVRRGRHGLWRLAPRAHPESRHEPAVDSSVAPAGPRAPETALVEARASRRDWRRLAQSRAHTVRLEPAWWREAEDADERWARRLVHASGWQVDELPVGELRTALTPLLEMRALVPWLEVRSSEQRLEALRPTSARLAVTVAQRRLLDGSGRRARVAELELHVAHPGDDELGELESWLERAGVERAAAEPLPRWLSRLGRSLGRPGSRRGKVSPTARADVAVRAVLRQLCDAIIANLPGTVAALDSEFLHDFRVAVRRSRSALGRMRRVLPERSRARFRRELRWLGQLSGPARDLDVYLLGFEARCASLPPAAHAGLGPLRRWLEARQAESHARLARSLCSRRASELLGDWESFLDRRPAGRPVAAQARAPIAAVAAREIRRAWRQVMAQGHRITAASPPADLHELRKSCKKLRYLLELFGALVDPEAARALVTPLKGLQRVLGDVQDLEVESALLAELGRALERRAPSQPAARRACQWLRDDLVARKQLARAGFDEAFAALANPASVELVRTRFGKRAEPPAR